MPTKDLTPDDADRKREMESRSEYDKRCANPWWPSKEITDAIDELISNGVNRYQTPDGETFIECRICGEWEGHTDYCPYPALEKWLGEDD